MTRDLVPGHVTPWATGLIAHRPSALLTHALFALADAHVGLIRVSFVTIFIDMVHLIQEYWETLVSGIQDGTVPDFEHIARVRPYLQASMDHSAPPKKV